MTNKEKIEWYTKQIRRTKHSEEEWLLLEKEFIEFTETLSKEELDIIVYSGLGEVIDMICSGIRYEKEAH